MTLHATDMKIDSLLEVMYRKYGYDFRDYSRAHIKRRIIQRLKTSNLSSVDMIQHRVLHDPEYTQTLLKDFSINVTEMFRDPDFYKMVREKVIPILKTWSYIKVWHAGCSTGEEVYSMAILLKEEGLYSRTQIYATDFNQQVLNVAKEGIYPIDRMQKYARNYQNSQPKASFSDYFRAQYDSVIMDNSLKENIVWANHNLVTDSDFTEAHIVICRNVLIYFNKQLQNKVQKLFYDSLVNGGILCLGNKESLSFTEYEKKFDKVDKKQKIYKKKYH